MKLVSLPPLMDPAYAFVFDPPAAAEDSPAARVKNSALQRLQKAEEKLNLTVPRYDWIIFGYFVMGIVLVVPYWVVVAATIRHPVDIILALGTYLLFVDWFQLRVMALVRRRWKVTPVETSLEARARLFLDEPAHQWIRDLATRGPFFTPYPFPQRLVHRVADAYDFLNAQQPFDALSEEQKAEATALRVLYDYLKHA